MVGKTVRPEPKPSLDIAPLQPGKARAAQGFLSEAPVMHSYQVVAKKRSENGSLWPKALSLAVITGILALVLVEKFPLQHPGQVEPRGPGLSASVQSDSAAGYSVPTETPASAIDAPIPPPKSTPVEPRGPRNVGSDESQEVIIRKFPRESNVGPAPSGNAQKLKGIFFGQDSAVIGWQYRPSLQQIADALAENPKASAILEGHTESSGPEAYNLDLSSRCAIAVRNALINELHVSRTRLIANIHSGAPFA